MSEFANPAEKLHPLPLVDTRGRVPRDLRISVTDRCNFRCGYCMPRAIYGSDFEFLPRADILSFEEITRVARVFVGLGVQKLRLTGGEPLLRAQLPKLVAMLSALNVELTLTTNGSLLGKQAAALSAAGLGRITVSLDALDQATFSRMADVNLQVDSVLEGIAAARAAGLTVKVNCVVRRGVNEHAIPELAQHFRGTGIPVRFIEFMDVGITNGWNLAQVVTGKEILAAIEARFPLEAVDPNYVGEVASRYRYRDGQGEVGVITSVTRPFCNTCSRARLSADGHLYTCLFASSGFDVRQLLRAGASDPQLNDAFAQVWRARQDAYSEQRTERTRGLRRIEMSYIGG
jgi:GTP 3',8-cyclase